MNRKQAYDNNARLAFSFTLMVVGKMNLVILSRNGFKPIMCCYPLSSI